jgi:hypothetical protein
MEASRDERKLACNAMKLRMWNSNQDWKICTLHNIEWGNVLADELSHSFTAPPPPSLNSFTSTPPRITPRGPEHSFMNKTEWGVMYAACDSLNPPGKLITMNNFTRKSLGLGARTSRGNCIVFDLLMIKWYLRSIRWLCCVYTEQYNTVLWYWMINRGPGFLAVIRFGSSPTPFPFFGFKETVSWSFVQAKRGIASCYW